MSLLAPWALWFSAVAAAVVALYLLKIKRRRQVVPALAFWRQFVTQTQVRSLFQRLKRWLSLLLWLIIVTCLILALGNPVFSFGSIKPRAIAVVLDNSASMSTAEDAGDLEDSGDVEYSASRLSLARDAIRDFTSRRPVSDEWLLIEATRQPRVVQAWTRDGKSVREAADALRPHAGSADLAAAISLARQLLEGKERPLTLLVSDGNSTGFPDPLPADESFIFWPIGASHDNLGITQLRVRTNRQQAEHHAYVRVVSAADEAVESRVVFEIDGSTASVEPFQIQPGASWEKTIVFNMPQGGVLRAYIDRADALAIDNEASAVLQPIRPAAVLLVTPPKDAFFFEQALLAMESLVDPETSRTIDIEEYDELPLPEFSNGGRNLPPPPDLVIFNNCSPKKLPDRGRFIFTNALPAELGVRVIGDLERPEMTLIRRDHALTRYLNLGGASLLRAKHVDLLGPANVLARTTEGAPLIFLVEQPDRQTLCLAFDVLDSDLPFRNAFPMLLRNAVGYLVTEGAAWIHDQYSIGDTIEPLRPLPADVKEVRVTRPSSSAETPTTQATQNDADGTDAPLLIENNSFVFRETGQRGPLRFTIGDDDTYTCVNLTDDTESRVRPVPTKTDAATQLGLSDRLFGMLPWLALAIVATMLIGFEWLTYHFRWTE